jgi:hypothetical protein
MDQLRQRQYWGSNYQVERAKAAESKKLVLLVIEGTSAASTFTFDRLIADEMQTMLLKPFIPCKVNHESPESRHILARCRYSAFPLILVVEPRSEQILRIRQGPFTITQWAEVLVEYARCYGG